MKVSSDYRELLQLVCSMQHTRVFRSGVPESSTVILARLEHHFKGLLLTEEGKSRTDRRASGLWQLPGNSLSSNASS